MKALCPDITVCFQNSTQTFGLGKYLFSSDIKWQPLRPDYEGKSASKSGILRGVHPNISNAIQADVFLIIRAEGLILYVGRPKKNSHQFCVDFKKHMENIKKQIFRLQMNLDVWKLPPSHSNYHIHVHAVAEMSLLVESRAKKRTLSFFVYSDMYIKPNFSVVVDYNAFYDILASKSVFFKLFWWFIVLLTGLMSGAL